MTENKELHSERRELDVLIGRGITFDVQQTTYKKRPGLLGKIRKKVRVVELVNYTIHEPTLAVLDRIAAEQLELIIDEGLMSSEAGVNEARKMAGQHTKRTARIVALSVMGEAYYKVIQRGGTVIYETDDKGLEELTMALFTFVKPSKLLQLSMLVNAISNLGDFMNSIRLMSAARTTMPVRIEEKQEG